MFFYWVPAYSKYFGCMRYMKSGDDLFARVPTRHSRLEGLIMFGALQEHLVIAVLQRLSSTTAVPLKPVAATRVLDMISGR